MKLSKELLRFESAHSGLAFREHLYSPDEDASLVRDLLGLANADAPDPRRLIIGVRDPEEGTRQFPGVDRSVLVEFRQRLLTLAARAIEPELSIRVTGANMGGATLAIVSLTDCPDRPYLVREPVGRLLPGTGFIRRGTQTGPLRRADLQTLLGTGPRKAGAPGNEKTPAATHSSLDVTGGTTGAAGIGAARAGTADRILGTDNAEVRVFFPLDEERTELLLPVLPLEEMPSAAAAKRIRAMLAAKKESRDVLGRTETRLSRLVHARMYGADTPFDEQSDDALALQLSRTDEDYKAADDYYRFETRAHKIQIAVRNQGMSNLKEATLELTLHLVEGTGVSGVLYTPDGTVSTSDAYPIIEHTDQAVIIRRSFDVLPAQAALRAFPEPPRLWAREAAIGKIMAVDYRAEAPRLEEPVTGTLTIRFTAPNKSQGKHQEQERT